jgi:hypothetical protein
MNAVQKPSNAGCILCVYFLLLHLSRRPFVFVYLFYSRFFYIFRRFRPLSLAVFLLPNFAVFVLLILAIKVLSFPIFSFSLPSLFLFHISPDTSLLRSFRYLFAYEFIINILLRDLEHEQFRNVPRPPIKFTYSEDLFSGSRRCFMKPTTSTQCQSYECLPVYFRFSLYRGVILSDSYH